MNKKQSWKFRIARALCLLAVAFLLAEGTASTFAQTTNIITLTNSDALATSSFASGFGITNWDNGLAPFSASPDVNAYLTTSNTLRTPDADGNNYTFAGDSLEVDGSGGTLSIKGYGSITVNDLILNGGKVVNNGTGGSPDTAKLAGNINVVADSTLDGGSTPGVTALDVSAPMAGTGGIAVQNSTVFLSASNSYAGQTTVNSGTLMINNSNAIPLSMGSSSVGNLRINNGTSVAGTVDMNGFDVTVNELITGNAATLLALITNSASTAGVTNTLTVGQGDASPFTYRGFIRDNAAAAGGKIALTKVGNAIFNLSVTVGNLNYSGDTTISGGAVNMGASLILPWGAGKGNLIINNPGELNMSGRSEVVNGLFGDGTIDDVATGNSTLNFGSNDVSSVFSGAIQSSASGIMQLQKSGAGTVTLSGSSSFNGPVTVNNGVLRITQNSGLGAGQKTIKISSATGDAQLHLDGSSGDLNLDSSFLFQTAGTNGAIVSEAGNNTIGGQIQLITGGATTLRVDAGTLTLSGDISILTNVTSRTLTLGGAANGIVQGVISDGSSANVPNTNILSLTKSGSGIWTLTNNNTYNDVTTINNGQLVLGATGSISNSSTINLQSNATFDVSAVGGWTLDASGGKAMKGSGNVIGDVTINGKIAPGDSLINLPIGTLTFANHLTLAGTTVMEINRTNTPVNADLIAASVLTFGGILTVTNTGGLLQGGDSFTLFTAPAKNGSFSVTNLPALSAGLAWTNTLSVDGKLTVVTTASPPSPHITSISLTGTQLVISGTNGTATQSYRVLTTTNLALAVTNWTAIATNIFGGSVFNITNTVDPAAPQNFYILSLP